MTSTPARLARPLPRVALPLLFLGACHRAPTPAPRPSRAPARSVPAARAEVASARSLVDALRARYPAWYHTIAFTQRTTVTLPSGGTLVQNWREAAELPGRLRIDTDLPSHGGRLYVRDSTFAFVGGKLVSADTGTNELLVLGFDAYTQPPARTDAALRRLGFDLSRFHEATWQGEPVFVIGALAGDTTSKQFWVTRDRLLFVRLLERTRQGVVDVRFDHYVPAGGGWVAEQVEEFISGRRRLLEQYENVKVGVPLSPSLFDPGAWTTAARPPAG